MIFAITYYLWSRDYKENVTNKGAEGKGFYIFLFAISGFLALFEDLALIYFLRH